MTAVAQLTTSLETDNDKTYEYDTRQPLQGGLSDKDVNFESVEHVAGSKNTKQTDSSVDGADKDYQDDDDDNQDRHDDDDSDGNAFIDAVEFVTSDYVTENDSKYRKAAKPVNLDGIRDGIHVANGADEVLGVDNMLQYKLTKAEADAVEAQENKENYNVELLKTETESTKLKNASGGDGNANNDASQDDDRDDGDGDDGKGESDDASEEDEELAVDSGITAGAEAEDFSADRMIAVADVTKPNRMLTTSKGRRALHFAGTAT
ncbi:protein PFC0760c-like [Zeugodacus cucurbitae]|uniref:protein PFC0760c-like n=1 Tax=Zeugodacus cucurbitae TaxID=28588 RepID=UPI0023D94258|nr:protein PFC0760c-like [Zeugodacus cucurbitae]